MHFKHVVVDGSNIATEARSSPSLQQLDEAVRAFLAEHDVDLVTVITDATFGHRIDPSETKAFDEAVDNAEIITPPAGSLGRGDSFILGIAEKSGATVLSNDSFQEFHAEHPWLFDEERLMGGKPIPGVGWVFLLRSPVRGRTSQRAVREAKKRKRDEAGDGTGDGTRAAKKKAAKKQGTKKKADKPADRKATAKKASKGSATKKAAGQKASRTAADPDVGATKPASGNDPMPFLEFVAEHSVGDTFEATVESFTSHGARVVAGDVVCYLPTAEMADPAPNRARDVVSRGEQLVVRLAAVEAAHRGLKVSLLPSNNDAMDSEDAKATTHVDDTGTTVAEKPTREEAPVTPAKKKASKKRPAKKAAKKTAARKAAPKKAAKKSPARKAAKKAAKKTTARKAAKKAAKKSPAKKKATAKKAAKKSPARKAAKKTAKKKAAARKR